MDFTYHIPVRLLFGPGKLACVGAETARYGGKALIVTGGSAKRSGLLNRVTALLQQSGVESELFDRVEPNPLTTTVEAGAAMAKACGADVVVGLGGGSALDTAKGIAFMARNEGDVSDYIFGRRTGKDALPLVLVPTTCGTGSEGNHFSVLTNPLTGDKKSLRCEPIFARVAVIDPELMATLPRAVVASVGFDALSHNMEAYYARAAQPLTDQMALNGIRLLAASLPRVLDNPADMAAWCDVTLASTLGGMAIGMAGVGAIHALEHPVSGLRNVTHGLGLAALTPEIIRRTVAHAPGRCAELSRALGGKDEQDFADTLRR
ncbi:MAG TPA: iron-containing alcohol dehydrogenase, partial [Candidatus Limiplasma sp.]|nr:iron-containing alcohol dehydrogenase [Candidatus Limiplasma sp.]